MNNYRQLQLNDQGLAFDRSTGASFTLNKTALVIMHGLKAGSNAEKLAETLANSFGIDIENAHRDVIDFFYRLKCFGLSGESK